MPSEAARKTLASVNYAKGRRGLTVERWMRTHGSAREFVETWLKMLVTGETDWSMSKLYRHLRDEHRFPFSAPQALINWIERTYPKEFKETR